MRVEVLENFYDYEMKTLHRKGDIFEVSKKRAVQIRTVLSNHIIEVPDESVNLNEMTKKELFEIALEKGIETNPKMTKAELTELLK